MRADDRPPSTGVADGTDAAALLRRHACRATKPRVAVLQAILDADRPVSAAELAVLATRQLEGIHDATVYRNIALLSELGIVTHVHAGHGPSLVKLASDTSVLAVCRRCGAIERVPDEVVDALAAGLADRRGFTVDLGHFALEGTCATCYAGA